MKTLRRIKLNQLCEAELEKKSMNELRGGDYGPCHCTCNYSGNEEDVGHFVAGDNWLKGGLTDSDVYAICPCSSIWVDGGFKNLSADVRLNNIASMK